MKSTAIVRIAAMTLLLMLFAQSGWGQTINIDIQPSSGNPLYTGNDGILSGSGTYWNPGTGQNLLDENGSATVVDVALMTTPGGFASGGTPHALYNDGIVANSSYWLDYKLSDLDPYKIYDIAVYCNSTISPYSRLEAWDETANPLSYGIIIDKYNYSGTQMPGFELYNYARYYSLKPYEASPGAYQIYLRIRPTQSTGGSFELVVGMQIKVTNTRTNIPPHYSILNSPTNNATGISLTPTLNASAFNDPDVGDTHANSQWQVDNNSSFSSPEWNSGDTYAASTSATLSAGSLLASTKYYWRVRYKDSSGNWSPYSSAFNFTTTAGNGAPTNILLSSTNVAENLPAGTTVGSFNTLDPDIGNTFTYTLVAGTGSKTSETIRSYGRQLFLLHGNARPLRLYQQSSFRRKSASLLLLTDTTLRRSPDDPCSLEEALLCCRLPLAIMLLL